MMVKELEIGEKLPNWELAPIVDGDKTPNVEDYLGKPFVVVFFSLNCPGCLGRAIPFANRIVFENGENMNVIGIHTHFEGPETTTERLLEAKDEFFIRFPYFKDTGFASTFHKYKAGGTPHWVIVDEKGTETSLTVDDLVTEINANPKFAPILKGSSGSGSGVTITPGRAGGLGDKPIKEMTSDEKSDFIAQHGLDAWNKKLSAGN